MTTANGTATAFERAQAILLLAPALFLLWPGPGALLAHDPFPVLTATAIAALGALLALAPLLAQRRIPRLRWIWLLLGYCAVVLASELVRAPTDTLEASRATLLLASALAMLVCGASLAEEGRAWLARGLAVLSLLATLPACFDSKDAFAGALGNSGSTSEVALLGAATGAWLAANEKASWRSIGALAALAYAFYAGLAPVLAGAVSLAFALAIAVAYGKRARALCSLVAVACALLFAGARLVPHPATPKAPAAVEARAPGDIGGFEIRELIWARVPELIADYGLFGAGPGQFGAAFPPYRDPREIELSSHHRSLPASETEVEHAHDDYLQGFVDAGPIGGALWLLFAALVAWRALRAAREQSALAPLALATLAVLANAVLREPLLWNAASSGAAFACIGALLASEAQAERRRWSGIATVALAAASLLIQLPRAWSIARHGRALARYVESGDVAFAELAGQWVGDSVVARSIAARRDESTHAWQAVLELRPHRFEALMELGRCYAEQHRVEEARTAWLHASAIDPGHPALLANLARLEAIEGDPEEAVRWLERAHTDTPAHLRGYAVAALRELRVERGWQLFARADERFADLSAEKAFAIAQSPDPGPSDEERAALEGSAHLTWAREHGGAGDAPAAVRSYRQAKRCLARRSAAGELVWANGLHLELAAALAASGQPDEAARELQGVVPSASDLTALPEWAGETLLKANLLAH